MFLKKSLKLLENGFDYCPKQRITQHKRFALWAHPNFCFAKTSFMLGTLCTSGKKTTTQRNNNDVEY